MSGTSIKTKDLKFLAALIVVSTRKSATSNPLLHAIESRFGEKDKKVGKVYVFVHKNNNRLVKIGWTEASGVARHGQGSNCYAINTRVEWESKESFVGAYRVESIAHKQLSEQNITLVDCRRC